MARPVFGRFTAQDSASLRAGRGNPGPTGAAVSGQSGLCEKRFDGSSGAPGGWNASRIVPGRKPKFSEPIRERLRSWLKQQPDLTLAELQEKLQATSAVGGERALAMAGAGKDGIASEKKSLHARERDTEENRQRGQEFLEKLRTIPPEKLIFLDESGVTTQMTRAWGRAKKGSGSPRRRRRATGRC